MAIRILENFDGTRYAVESYHDGVFRVKAHDLGNGHVEVSGVERTVWRELDWSQGMIQDHLDMLAQPENQVSDEEKRARSLEVAANRAKTRVRKLCKAMGADTLLTLTYKANQDDLSLCKAHLKEFVRRVRRLIPDFRAVAGFEKVKDWLAAGRVKVLLQASDGSERGKGRLWTPEGARWFGCLTASELGLAFGRDHVIHSALSRGGLADKIIRDAGRLNGLRGNRPSGPGRNEDADE